ncbi:MAG: Ig-like domain repeat protein [Terriglobales bacterium]|jgi:poly(3-hydroxybutyrate) depolymerase
MKAARILIAIFVGTAASLSAALTTTTTTISSSLNPSVYGQSVTFTAIVSSALGPPPNGEIVTFLQGKTTLGSGALNAGSATFTTSTLAAGGTDSVKAVYPGDANFSASASTALKQVVSKASTTTSLGSSQNPSAFGQSVTFTATVVPEFGGTVTGTVTFMSGSTRMGNGTVSGGIASLATTGLTVGTDAITAVYNGSGSFASSTSSAVSQAVNQASTTTALTSSVNPSKAGQSVTFTATVTPQFSGTPSGNLAFYEGTTLLKTGVLTGGVATLKIATLASGADTITATYAGGADFTTSSASLVQTVNGGGGGGTYIDSQLTWDGVTRYYEVYLPANLPANPPLVLMLHGTRTTVATGDNPQPVISLNWGWPSVADTYGFILVKPASTYDPTTHQWNWNSYFMDGAFPYAQGCGAKDCPDDSGFLGQLIANLKSQYDVNPDRVYLAGFSSGAQMAERVGVDLAGIVAAIAPASGQLVNVQGIVSPPLPLPMAPNPFPPLSVQEWHGTLDTELPPCNYGTTTYSGVTFTLDTVDDTFNYWVAENGCTTLETTEPLCANAAPNNANDAPTPGMPGLTGNIASNCAATNTAIQFIWEPNIEHSFQQQYDTARWQFFAAHPLQPIE